MKSPSCDRHKNLQMVPFFLEFTGGTFSGHVCPVPGCGRYHSENGYFNLVDGKPAWQEKTIRSRITSARNEILRAIRAGA